MFFPWILWISVWDGSDQWTCFAHLCIIGGSWMLCKTTCRTPMVGRWHFLWALGPDRSDIFRGEMWASGRLKGCYSHIIWLIKFGVFLFCSTSTRKPLKLRGTFGQKKNIRPILDLKRIEVIDLSGCLDEFLISPTSKLPWKDSGGIFPKDSCHGSFAKNPGEVGFSLPQDRPQWVSPPFLPSFVSSLWVPCTGQTVKKTEKYLMNVHVQTNIDIQYMIYACKWTHKWINANTHA